MQNKSQSSIYVILGLVFIFSILVVMYMINNQEVEKISVNTEVERLDLLKDSTRNLANACIKEKTLQAITLFGMREESIEDIKFYLNTEIDKCVNTTVFENRGAKIKKGELLAGIEFSEQTVNIDIFYPISIEIDDNFAHLDTFTYSFPREIKHTLLLDESGKTAEEYIISTSDNKAFIKIPQGIEMRTKDGEPAREISLRIVDKYHDQQINYFVIGNTIMEAQPHGLEFSEPVELIFRMEAEELPEGWTKQDAIEKLSIGYKNPAVDIWFELPTEVDDSLTLRTEIEHFSEYATVFIEPNLLNREDDPSETHAAISYSYSPEDIFTREGLDLSDYFLAIEFEDTSVYDDGTPVLEDPGEMCNADNWKFNFNKYYYKSLYDSNGPTDSNTLYPHLGIYYSGYDPTTRYVDTSIDPTGYEVSDPPDSVWYDSLGFIDYDRIYDEDYVIISEYFTTGVRFVNYRLNTRGGTAVEEDAKLVIALLCDNVCILRPVTSDPYSYLTDYLVSSFIYDTHNVYYYEIPFSDFENLGFSSDNINFKVSSLLTLPIHDKTTMCPKIYNVAAWIEGGMYPNCEFSEINTENPYFCVCENGEISYDESSCHICGYNGDSHPRVIEGQQICVMNSCSENEEEHCDNNLYHSACEMCTGFEDCPLVQMSYDMPSFARHYVDCNSIGKICSVPNKGCIYCRSDSQCRSLYGGESRCVEGTCMYEKTYGCVRGYYFAFRSFPDVGYVPVCIHENCDVCDLSGITYYQCEYYFMNRNMYTHPELVSCDSSNEKPDCCV